MSTELILLGTAGGPTPRGSRHAPSQVIVVDGVAYVIDCGNGVAQQLHLAGVEFSSMRSVFITHHHSDHNADVGNLFLLSWPALKEAVSIFGPPPLTSMMNSFLEMNKYDISVRVKDEERPHLGTFINAQEIIGPGLVYSDEKVQVTAALVDHPPIDQAYAYRFDTHDRSIVISGDTRPSDELVELAMGADVLVHEAIFEPAISTILGNNNGRKFLDHLLGCHTAVEKLGPLAERAKVGKLVLSHLSPSNDVVSDEVWAREAQRGYSGEVVVGRDLLSL